MASRVTIDNIINNIILNIFIIINIIIMFSQSCGIDLGDRYVVIGGKDKVAGRKVTLYKDTGFYRSRPELLVGRYGHSCAKFKQGNGEMVGSLNIF